jgi:hypothetical protein
MEKCPNCGYKVGSRWSFVLIQLAFCVLYFSGKYGWLKNHDWITDVALAMYLIGTVAVGLMWDGRTAGLKEASGKPGGTI